MPFLYASFMLYSIHKKTFFWSKTIIINEEKLLKKYCVCKVYSPNFYGSLFLYFLCSYFSIFFWWIFHAFQNGWWRWYFYAVYFFFVEIAGDKTLWFMAALEFIHFLGARERFLRFMEAILSVIFVRFGFSIDL